MNLVLSRWHRVAGPVLVFCSMASAPAWADRLVMAVHPVLSAAETRQTYQLLAAYLNKRTGHDIEIATSANFLVHWQVTKRGQSALLIEGPHMVDYRIKKMGYTVLAKMPEVISYTLVAHQDRLAIESQDLVGKSVATLPAPSLGAVQLNQIFPNPLRQPVLVEVDDMESAVKRVMEGKAAGAIIPSAMVGRFTEVTPVATTGQAPSPGITAAPWVNAETKRALRQALLDAHNDPEGQAALKALRLGRFDAATPAQFDGYARLLEGMWGY